jgi:hypothetical protein
MNLLALDRKPSSSNSGVNVTDQQSRLTPQDKKKNLKATSSLKAVFWPSHRQR